MLIPGNMQLPRGNMANVQHKTLMPCDLQMGIPGLRGR